MKKLLGMAALCGLCVCTSAHAADIRMDEVVVSANKMETSASEVTSSVTVITGDDMDAQQARTLVEVLRNVPGVFMGNAQGPAGTNTFMIRGSKSRYTQLRFNGIPLREAGSIDGNFESFLGAFNVVPGAVGRVEVLKGSQGSLYGSSASGGVISLYSDNKWDSGLNASLDVGAGSYGTFTSSGQISYGDDRYYIDAVPYYARSDGHNGVWYKQGGFTLGAGLRLSEKTSIELTSLAMDFESAAFNSPYFSDGKWSKLELADDALKTSGRSILLGLSMTHEVHDAWTVQGKAALTRSERQYRLYGSEFLGDTYYVELLNTVRPLDNLTLIAGAEYEGQKMEIEDSAPRTDEAAGAFSAYAKGLLSFLDKKLALSAGGRFNKHEDYDSKATWDMGISYTFDTGTRIHGNVATGFYSPSLYQRYGNGGWLKANPDLDSESSISYEVGVEQKLWSDKVVLSATAFATEYDDQVAWNYYSGNNYYNADKAKVRGLELGVSVYPNDRVRLDLGYTHASSKQKMAGGEWTHSFQMPEDKFVGTLYLFPVKKLKLTFTGRWESARKNEYGDIMDDAFFTVDMAASYDVTDHLQVYAKVNNILDEDYAVYGWEMPGINAMAGVRYTF